MRAIQGSRDMMFDEAEDWSPIIDIFRNIVTFDDQGEEFEAIWVWERRVSDNKGELMKHLDAGGEGLTQSRNPEHDSEKEADVCWETCPGFEKAIDPGNTGDMVLHSCLMQSGTPSKL